MDRVAHGGGGVMVCSIQIICMALFTIQSLQSNFTGK